MNMQRNMQPAVQMATHTTVQLPAGDLFNGGRREYNDLYIASAKGDLEAAKNILQHHENLVRYGITPNNETPLHIAVMSKNSNFVEYLVGLMSKSDLELRNRDGNTAFCLAAISGNVSMAEKMVEKNPELPVICGTEKTMPLDLAIFYQKHEMVAYLYELTNKIMGWTNERMNVVLLKCIRVNMLDLPIKMLKDNEKLPQDEHVWDVLRELAQNPKAFKNPTIISRIKSCLDHASKESKGMQLLKLLLKRVAEKPMDMIHELLRGPVNKKDEPENDPSHILFIAAKVNNSRFLVELFREFPDLIWQRNDAKQTIFHIAVALRHHDVYNILHDIGSMREFITPIVDKDGNNILHMVGKIPEKNAYDDSETTPFEILREYFWYKEVESILPSPCIKVKNNADKTPKEEFISGHKDVINKGTNWIYETINQSMVVATLVSTIGFAIVFSLPGGYDQNNGYPTFRKNKTFNRFIFMHSLSAMLSSTAINIFLSIILSRHEQKKELLIEKWLAGQLTLMASLFSLGLSFLFSFFLLYHNNILPYIISAIGIILALSFVKEQHSLGKEVLYMTVTTVYYFRIRKKIIYVKSQISK